MSRGLAFALLFGGAALIALLANIGLDRLFPEHGAGIGVLQFVVYAAMLGGAAFLYRASFPGDQR